MTLFATYDPHSPREVLADEDVAHPLQPPVVPLNKTGLQQNGQCRGDHPENVHSGNDLTGNDHPSQDLSTIPLMDDTTPTVVHCKTVQEPEEYEGSENDADTHCGIGSLRPHYLQRFTNKKAFLAVFCLASVLQGMYYTYFVSVLTTIEKLFQIQSKTTGIIMSATEMGQIGGALLLSYYGGHGHRPKWIACGMLLFAFASFLCSLPHFLYGSQLSQSLNIDISLSKLRMDANLCIPHDSLMRDNMSGFGNMSAQSLTSRECQEAIPGNRSYITNVVLGIFFVSLLCIGIGSTAVYTLGIPYIDDNVANRDSPLYFAITIGVRILGPVFGFLLGSLCTMLYVNPFEKPVITNEDPRWIGAWWLGPFIVAAALVFVSFAMLAFPRRLPTQRILKFNGYIPPAASESNNGSGRSEPISSGSNSALMTWSKPTPDPSTKPTLGDFPVALRRLLKNEILLFRTASTVLHILPIAGLYTFLPKYLESQFRLTATKANMISGIAGILVMGVGIFASGTFMRRFKPNARFVAGWIALTALAYAIGMVILSFIGCPITDFTGLQEGLNGLEIKLPCNTTCGCDQQVFAPVCTSDGQTYYSACHAGCQDLTYEGTNPIKIKNFLDCDCLGQNVTATSGYCPLQCNNFIWYICIFSLFVLIHSTSEVGSMLLTLRCVDPKDKAMALGLISFAIGLFGNVPCPIIYGAVVDSACVVWKYVCGQRGACWFYDPSVFRTFFHGMTGAIMFLAFLVDAVVWYKASRIRFSEDDSPKTDGALPADSCCSQFETTV